MGGSEGEKRHLCAANRRLGSQIVNAGEDKDEDERERHYANQEEAVSHKL